MLDPLPQILILKGVGEEAMGTFNELSKCLPWLGKEIGEPQAWLILGFHCF